MATLACSSLSYFKDKCFGEVVDSLRGAILNQITKDRDGEHVDWDLLKNSIQAFVQVSFINADVIKLDDDYVWRGDKNLMTYDNHFEKFLLTRVHFPPYFILVIIVF
jgi:hypothetical protein